MTPIRWQVFLRVGSERAADKVLTRLVQTLGAGARVLERERYWKDPALFRASVTSPASAADVSRQVLEVLVKGASVARHWIVSGPQFYDGDRWEFSGWADNSSIAIPGIAEIDFQTGSVQGESGQQDDEASEKAACAQNVPMHSPPNQVIVERLLSEVAERADGAVSFWTSMCLVPEELVPEPWNFVAANGETLRSFAVSLRAILAEDGLTGDDSVRGPVTAMIDACRRIEESALTLARFRAVPLADVRTATQTLGEAYTDLLDAVRQAGEVLGCSIPYWRQRTAERERYFQQILQGLFGLFRDAHPDSGR